MDSYCPSAGCLLGTCSEFFKLHQNLLALLLKFALGKFPDLSLDLQKLVFWEWGLGLYNIKLSGRLMLTRIWEPLDLGIGEGNGTPLQYSCLENPMDGGPGRLQSMGSLRVWLSDFTFTLTFHFHALEKEMATHSSVLAWRIPGTGEPRGLPSVGSHRVIHDWSDLAAAAATWEWIGLILIKQTFPWAWEIQDVERTKHHYYLNETPMEYRYFALVFWIWVFFIL